MCTFRNSMFPTRDEYFNRNQTNETHAFARETVEGRQTSDSGGKEFEGLQSIKMFMISKKSEFFKAKRKFLPISFFFLFPVFLN